MAKVFRKETKKPEQEQRPRWTVGLFIGPGCRTIEASLVSMRGRHAGSPVEIRQTRRESVPDEIVTLYHNLIDPSTKRSISGHLRRLSDLRDLLAELEAACVIDLVTEARLAPAEVSAVGLVDPGLWSFDLSDPGNSTADNMTGDLTPVAYEPISDAIPLAERTGMNVIDRFPSRDIAQGGRGGPLSPITQWILLKANAKNRLLLDLGHTLRSTYLPKASTGNPRGRIITSDIAPGFGLLDAITPDATGEQLDVAEVNQPLVDAWMQSDWINRQAPNWRPDGIPAQPFLDIQEQQNVLHQDAQTSDELADLLLTTLDFQAEATANYLERSIPLDADLREVVLRGDLRYSQTFIERLSARMPKLTFLTLDSDYRIPNDTFESTCTALATFLHLDQVPINLQLVTGAEIARVLGELTPGSPRSWQKLLKELTGAAPTIRPLRSAL